MPEGSGFCHKCGTKVIPNSITSHSTGDVSGSTIYQANVQIAQQPVYTAQTDVSYQPAPIPIAQPQQQNQQYQPQQQYPQQQQWQNTSSYYSQTDPKQKDSKKVLNLILRIAIAGLAALLVWIGWEVLG
jgi:hypothetical protein